MLAPIAGAAHHQDHGSYFEGSDSDTSDDEDPSVVFFGDEPDTTQWTENEVAEFLYERHKAYKKRWRAHVGKRPRFQRCSAPHQGKGRRSYYSEAAYFQKGKGGGKKGKSSAESEP
mgnify:CR=1 FL=1